MIKIRTKVKIDLETAFQFEVSKGEEGIRKRDILEQNDCYWELIIKGYSMSADKFNASIEWRQLIEYPINESEYNYIPKVMFIQDFELDQTMIQQMWYSLCTSHPNFQNGITPQDNYLEKVDEFVTAGILLWVGDVQNYFGLDSDDFEVVV